MKSTIFAMMILLKTVFCQEKIILTKEVLADVVLLHVLKTLLVRVYLLLNLMYQLWVNVL